jgi:D-ala-D-ala dipeptidase
MPDIHVFLLLTVGDKTRMAGTSPATTIALVAAMARQGFVNYAKEWWHFSLPAAAGPAYDFPITARRSLSQSLVKLDAFRRKLIPGISDREERP